MKYVMKIKGVWQKYKEKDLFETNKILSYTTFQICMMENIKRYFLHHFLCILIRIKKENFTVISFAFLKMATFCHHDVMEYKI